MALSNIVLENLTDCPICNEKFNLPRFLPCYHTYCQHCLKDYIESEIEKHGKSLSKIKCVVCQSVFPLIPDTEPEKYVAELPMDNLALSIIKRKEVGDSENICYPCKRIDITSPAVCYCSKCVEFLCKDCEKYHKTNKSTSNHLLVSIAKIVKETDLLKHAPPVICPEHRESEMAMYCFSHEVVCCSSCVSEHHSQCKTVATVEHAVARFKEKRMFEAFNKNLQKSKLKYEEEIKKGTEHLGQLDHSASFICAEIEEMRKMINKHFDDLEVSAKKQLVSIKNEQTAELEDRIDEFRMRSLMLEDSEQVLKAFVQNASPGLLLFEMKRLKNQHMECEKFIHQSKTLLAKRLLGFEPDKNVAGITSSLKHMGKVFVKGVFDVTRDVPKNTMTLKTKRKNARITGISSFPDGRIVVTDENNCTLTLFDGEGKEVNELVLLGKPWDVATLDRHRCVITMRGLNVLQYVNVNDMTLLRQIAIDDGCWGVSVYGEELVIGFDNKVEIFDFGGRSEHVIPCLGSDYYVTIDNLGRFYHKHHGNTLHCRHVSGKFAFSYYNAELVNLTGITIDNDGNIYVAGFHSNNVHQLTPDGTLTRIILSGMDGIYQPLKLHFSKDFSKLLVANNNGSSVAVYSFTNIS
ncbi:E3 ubiquitin-protein ligase TRIM71-like [Mytilus californianus]|uniref:E3 ubiquitin-protein ligase TRIM71-like n=1 Tax=Mytilus californianus TaxID=6549 RepID=UPI002247A7D8|nr:E3 ubiquitin-protein ligase TRIM71-like [Mytilus californianus]